MQSVKIDDTWYEVDEKVVLRMSEYYDTMQQAVKELDNVKLQMQQLRDVQKEYFRKRDPRLLSKAKQLEQEIDDLLAGKVKPKEVQTELFR